MVASVLGFRVTRLRIEMTRWLYGVAVALVTMTPLLCADEQAKGDSLLGGLLRSGTRSEVITALDSWARALSEVEIRELENLVQKNRNSDWRVYYAAERLLRAQGIEKHHMPGEIERAEELFAGMGEGSGRPDYRDRYVDELATLGGGVVPLLVDLLEYTGDHDHERKRVAIRVLGLLKDDRIVPALREAARREGSRNHLEEELLALLRHDSNEDMVDWASRLIAERKDPFDQEYIVAFLSQSELTRSAKMRLYSHYNEYKSCGKHAVIRGLQAIDDKAAFHELAAILRGRDTDGFSLAARALGQLRNSDPCAFLHEVLEGTPGYGGGELILAVAERKCEAAVPLLQKRLEGTADNVDGRRHRILVAGALCRFGKDYDGNAAIVRDGLKDYWSCSTAYQVVGWLSDEETVQAVISQIGSKEPDERAGAFAIEALGRMGSESAVRPLRDALSKLSVAEFVSVGEAIEAIGRKSGDQELIDEGQGIRSLGKVLHGIRFLSCTVISPTSPEGKRLATEMERAGSWLKMHPEPMPNIMQQIPGSMWDYERFLLLLDRAWDERVIPDLEKVISTDISRVSVHTSRGIVPHYRGRSAVAAFLTRKTGKKYAFTDADGTVRKGGEWPE